MDELIGILRGVRPEEVVAIADAVADAGITTIEVPLNSPDPFRSIEALARWGRPGVRVGAGTVLTAADVRGTAEAGGVLCVSPNYSAAVVEETVRLGLASCPGVATPSEAFAALASGAGVLKLFPSEQVGVAGLRAWRSVLPRDTPVFPVGGIDEATIAGWVAAGASGFGIGSSLYKPGMSPAEVGERATRLVAAFRAATEASR